MFDFLYITPCVTVYIKCHFVLLINKKNENQNSALIFVYSTNNNNENSKHCQGLANIYSGFNIFTQKRNKKNSA